jgi:hypothetical protein
MKEQIKQEDDFLKQLIQIRKQRKKRRRNKKVIEKSPYFAN